MTSSKPPTASALIRLIQQTPHPAVISTFDLLGRSGDRFSLTAAQVLEGAMRDHYKNRLDIVLDTVLENRESREYGILSRAVTLASRGQ